MTDLENILRKDLFQISASWADLLDLPRSATAVTTHNDAPMPLPLAVLSLRVDACHQLAAWAHLVRDERNLTIGLNLLDTVAVCRFLTRHAAFLAVHPAGRDACAEIGHIADQITELVAQTQAHRFVIGRCPDCEGMLLAVMRNSDALLPSEVRCSTGAHSWTPFEWSRLGERLRRWDEGASMRLIQMIVR